jgi:hypothetical protein
MPSTVLFVRPTAYCSGTAPVTVLDTAMLRTTPPRRGKNVLSAVSSCHSTSTPS